MIADYGDDIELLLKQPVPEKAIPVLATRNLVVFPGVITPILIGRSESLHLVLDVENFKHGSDTMLIVPQKDPRIEHPTKKSDLFEYGIYAKLIKVLDVPGQGNTF